MDADELRRQGCHLAAQVENQLQPGSSLPADKHVVMSGRLFFDHRGHRGTQRKTNIFFVFYAFSAVKTGNGGGRQWELNRKEHKERKEGAAEQVRRLDLGTKRDRARPEPVEGSLSKGACRREPVEGSLSKGAWSLCLPLCSSVSSVVVQVWGAEPGIRTGCVGLVNELPNGIGFHPRP